MTDVCSIFFFHQYVAHTHGICEDADDSAEVFYKHHSFLLSQMIQGREDVQWTETTIFKHLAEKFPVRFTFDSRCVGMFGC